MVVAICRTDRAATPSAVWNSLATPKNSLATANASSSELGGRLTRRCRVAQPSRKTVAPNRSSHDRRTAVNAPGDSELAKASEQANQPVTRGMSDALGTGTRPSHAGAADPAASSARYPRGHRFRQKPAQESRYMGACVPGPPDLVRPSSRTAREFGRLTPVLARQCSKQRVLSPTAVAGPVPQTDLAHQAARGTDPGSSATPTRPDQGCRGGCRSST
jgi:hypothetical protein